MSRQELQLSTDVAQADWLRPRLRPFASAVAAVVPDGFAAYVSIPHRENGFEGNLPANALRVLCATLSQHTTTPSACYFCLWDGYGWLYGSPHVARLAQVHGDQSTTHVLRSLPPALSARQLRAQRVHLPNRDYLLFTGLLEAAAEEGLAGYGTLHEQSPNLFWPSDHAWCVASEIDLAYTLVAGSQPLADALVADVRLQAVRVGPGDALTADGPPAP